MSRRLEGGSLAEAPALTAVPRRRPGAQAAGRLRSAPVAAAIGLVWLYRWTFGLLVPAGTCKYHPSCSEYAIQALRKHGLIRGSARAAWRLLRCNPWSHGGVDYP